MKDFGSQIKYVGGNEGDKCNYSARLDTYGCGCQHDCSYCYAKSLLDFRGLWNPKNPYKEYGARALAKKFNVSTYPVMQVAHGKGWKHIQ